MTPQEIFDETARHLFAMNSRAGMINEHGHFVCKYRTTSGRTCAVGHFITESNYSPSMEGNRLDTLLKDFADRLPSWMADNVELMVCLQEVHDDKLNWKSTKGMKYELNKIADTFGLSTTVVECLSFEDR